MTSEKCSEPIGDQPFSAAPGPWGRIEFAPFKISPPADFASAYRGLLGLDSKRWNFVGQTSSSLPTLLAKLGLHSSRIDTITSQAFDDLEQLGLAFLPDDKFVQDLTPAERSELYHWLAHANGKNWQANAFRFRGEFSDWFADTPLQPRTIQLVESLVYRRGDYLLFADLPLVAEQLQEQAEFAKLIKVLARETTMLAKLHLSAEDDLESLIEYWSRGRRAEDIRPIIESLGQSRRNHAIDIVHLLPSFARRFLYTYPPFTTEWKNSSRDCHWTSMNFFQLVPEDSMSNLQYVAEVVIRDWQQIFSPPMLGDLVFFQDQHENIFHSAVYIADNVLFTKNGPAVVRPWILMRESDLFGFYPQQTAVEVLYYRRRDLL